LKNPNLDEHQIRGTLFQFYFKRGGYTLYFDIFGLPTLFYKIEEKVRHARELICPHCGEKGIFLQKTTVSKRKYRYKKLYVYHETTPIPTKTSLRNQKWCYLNENDLNDPAIQKRLQQWVHAQHVEEYFYKCLRLP